MSDQWDIVRRLRYRHESMSVWDNWGPLCEQAAEEIERLRAKVVALEHASGLTRLGKEDTHP